MSPPQGDRLTGLHGRGIGGRAGRPSARPVVSAYSYVVLGVGVQVGDSGTGAQPCCPHSVRSRLFVPSFPVADLRGAGIAQGQQSRSGPRSSLDPGPGQLPSVPLLPTLVLGQAGVSPCCLLSAHQGAGE